MTSPTPSIQAIVAHSSSPQQTPQPWQRTGDLVPGEGETQILVWVGVEGEDRILKVGKISRNMHAKC